ncbi:MAG TPA: sigma-70 family RNA polymerase sigma factor [Candidatus Eisenbacteria bacterium]|nr:sigma-70 family RNA polymerase sigma factor [Candidatus Eisenbacteria bacterium]
MASQAGNSIPDLLHTSELVTRAKRGDAAAMQALMARYHSRLTKWARGRLPLFARSLLDTSDLVQETLLKVFEGIDKIEVRDVDTFHAYVRRAIVNRINDQIRWARRRPDAGADPDQLTGRTPLPIEDAIEADLMDQYERALEQLSDEERHLVHLRIELDFSYAEIATMTGRNTSDAARMAVQRSLRRLATILGGSLE